MPIDVVPTVVGVIPARYGSTRFPGKPLQKIKGIPLLQRVVEAAKSAKELSRILVATDDERIVELCQKIDVDAVMTDSALPSGSDRIRAALKGREADIVLNIQGDEPLITGTVLDQLVLPLKNNPKLEMATLARTLQPGDLDNPNTAKIVVNQQGQALYFSRLPIPFSKNRNAEQGLGLKHIGIYGFRRSFLEKFCDNGPVELELAEGLEQLRALYLGASIKVIKVDIDSWGVDTPEDVAKVENKLNLLGKE